MHICCVLRSKIQVAFYIYSVTTSFYNSRKQIHTTKVTNIFHHKLGSCKNIITITRRLQCADPNIVLLAAAAAAAAFTVLFAVAISDPDKVPALSTHQFCGPPPEKRNATNLFSHGEPALVYGHERHDPFPDGLAVL